MILPNEELLSRASQAVAIGKTAIIPVKGQSMYPFIRGSEDCVELSLPTDIKQGDIVLAEVSPGKYLLHRIYNFQGEDGIILMGDGNIHNKEYCLKTNVKAKALVVITKNGRKKRLDSLPMIVQAKIWKICLPIRGFLLRILWKLKK